MEKEAFSWNDLLTGDRFVISPNRYQKILSQWAEELIKEVEDKTSLRKLCDALVVAMTGPPYPILRANGDETTYRGSLPPAIHSPGSFLNDHLLLTSAIAYALGYEKDLPPGEIQLLRLSALAHDLPAEQREKLLRGLELEEEERAQVKALWETLQTWGQDMEDLLTRDTCFPLPSSLASPPEDLPSRILYYAHLAASEPLYDFSFEVDGRKVRVLGSKALLQQHPLAKAEKDLGLEKPIGLVLGGATKIKEYVFESSKLPEIRGASNLLDRINRYDLPALCGSYKKGKEAEKLYEEILAWLDAQGEKALDTPEGIIYANGGDILAIVPASEAERMARLIEARYVDETLTARAVAAWERSSLLELHYGLRPTEFWVEDYLAVWRDPELRPLLEDYYGRAGDEDEARKRFFLRKAFGELSTLLSLKRHRRRDGNPKASIPHFEVIPHAHRCHSCDRRPGIRYAREFDHYLCEPCGRKTALGLAAKKFKCRPESLLQSLGGWEPRAIPQPWYEKFEGDLINSSRSSEYSPVDLKDVDNPWDLGEIAQASDPQGFIGIIYADGNNVGSIIERIRTPSEYRQFAERVYEATQEAVFEALATHLKAHQVTASEERIKWTGKGGEVWIHPFEIIGIGGDDLFLIVPGSKALDIATEIAEGFERHLKSCSLYEKISKAKDLSKVQRCAIPDDSGQLRYWRPRHLPKVSLSVGVIIADEKTPIFFLEELVEELLKNAKGKAKAMKHEKGYWGGTVDFQVLKAVPMITTQIRDFRSSAYLLKQNGQCLRLTARPYTLWEMKGLLKTARIFQEAEFPRSQLHTLRRFLRLGRLAAIINCLYFLVRSRQREALLLAFQQAWHPSPNLPPWREVRAGVYESILEDLAEIYEFVERR